MFLELLLFLIIISIIIYICIVLYYKYKHPFWFKQSVDFIFSLETDEGRISMYDNIHRYNKDYTCSTWNNTKEIIPFLNENFQPGGYTFNYNESTCNNCYFFKVSKGSEICGCISAKPIDSRISGKQQTIWYVDHLAIKREHRSKRLVSDLITCILDTIGDQIYLFKKDIKPLPFKYFCKYKYYEVLDNIGLEQPNVIEQKDTLDSFFIENKRVSINDKENLIFLEKGSDKAIIFYTDMIDKSGNPIFEIGHAENKRIAQLAVNFIKKKNPDSKILVNNLAGTSNHLKTRYLSENYLYFYNYRIEAINPNDIFLSLP